MSRTLSEAESKRLLRDHGVPILVERVVTTPEEAVDAATELGYPVVAKLCGDAIAHKTERGLVRLDLTDADQVASAARDLFGRATPADGEVGVLVAPMVRGNRELIAGLSDDPQFGMTVMLGVGGILAEALADVSTTSRHSDSSASSVVRPRSIVTGSSTSWSGCPTRPSPIPSW